MLLPPEFDRLIQEEMLEGVRSGSLPPEVIHAVRIAQRQGAGMLGSFTGGPTLPPGTQAIYNSYTRPSMLVTKARYSPDGSNTPRYLGNSGIRRFRIGPGRAAPREVR